MKRIIFLLFTMLTVCACEKTSDPKTPEIESGVMFIQMNLKSMPAEVKEITGMLTRSGYEPIAFEFEMTDNSAYSLIENIAEGTWILQVDAYNSDGDIIYTASQEIEILTNQLTSVALELMGTGSLEIIVTWGDVVTTGEDEFEDNDQLQDAAPIYEGVYYSNLTVTNLDDDWYSIAISASRIAVVCNYTRNLGDLNIDLVDKNGNVLVSSINLHDYEIIDFTVDELVTYYIHVYTSSGNIHDYMIWWEDF